MRSKMMIGALFGLVVLLATKAMPSDMAVPRDPKYPAHWWTPVPTMAFQHGKSSRKRPAQVK